MTTALALASVLLAAAGCSKSRPPAQLVEVSVVPASADIAPGVQTQLVANVAGAADTAVEWKVEEPGGGTVTAKGLYTSPLKGGIYHVRAISRADPARAGVAEMRVITSVPAILAFAARPASVIAGRPSWLSWEVTEATAVSIDQGVGPVSGTSVTVSPAATTTYTLTASNVAGKITATAKVTVAEGVYLPPGAAAGDVTFAVDSGSASPISPYIYGVNFAEQGGNGWST